ncbi:MAG: succinate dehydrogenase, cytochrome b556 subunit [Chloroflexi bacterium]|nr:succinate dehydrogenase, cytochrome b556 subunit [Chloroflexota bacterium]
MSGPSTAFKGYIKYRGYGHVAFLLHRLTGLGTLLFLLIHIIDTSFVYFWPEGYMHAIALYRSTPFMIGEIFLVFSVIYHGVNGLRIIYFDMFRPDLWERETGKRSVIWTLIISIVLWLPAALIMVRNILVHH